jgi:2-desacetyl-2-hydroxyethyl bacteriochlorophyllide A dehydrogenase
VKAAVRVAPGRIEILDRPAPARSGSDALIRVEQVALCGGDLHYFRGPMPFGEVIPGYVDAPRIVCHEALGEVVEAPEGTSLTPGDRVTFDPQERCEKCPACLAGDIELCLHRRDMGYSADGAATELVAVPGHRVFPVPDTVDASSATATHGLAAVLHALSRVDLSSAGHALVAGPGPAGLMFTMALVAQLGEERVALLGRRSPRLRIGADVGAETIELDDATWDELHFEWGEDRGFDLIVDTTGSPDVIERLLACVRPKGTLLLYAPTRFTLDGHMVFRRELQVIGSTGATGEMAHALSLMASGRVDLSKIITHTFDFEDIQDAFELAVAEPARRGDLLKAIVRVA